MIFFWLCRVAVEVPGGLVFLGKGMREWRGAAGAGGKSGGWPWAGVAWWLRGRGGEAGEGCAASAAGAGRESCGGALGVAGLAGGPGGHDPLGAGDEQGRGEQGDGCQAHEAAPAAGNVVAGGVFGGGEGPLGGGAAGV